MNREDIFKNLKQKYEYLTNELGYEVVYLALQGSQNYGMDLYTDNYTSDIDCFAIILPSLDDVIQNRAPVSDTIILKNNEHIGIKDIREMFKLYRKQNVQFLETLFSDYIIKNRKYSELLNELFSLKEDIAKINKGYLYMSIIGMSKEKSNALTHPYPSIKDKIDKYGYDGKQLHHQIRLNQFIKNIDNGMSFKKALTYFEPEIKDMCLKAKLNEFTLEEAIMYDKIYCDDTYTYKNQLSDDDYIENTDITEKLDTIKAGILKSYFKSLLTDLVERKDYKMCPDQYANVFVTSDNHFGHSNILKYEKGRLELLDVNLTEKISRYIIDNNLDVDDDTQFKQAYSKVLKELTVLHDEVMISRWNEVVKKNDLVIILGDFSFHKANGTMEILNRLNGDKVLIEGNHDCIYLDDKKFDRSLYKAIYDYTETTYRGQKMCLMHYPIKQFKHIDKDVNCYVHLFGHIHSVPLEIPRHSFNVGVDVNDYRPVKLEYAIEQALLNSGGSINGKY